MALTQEDIPIKTKVLELLLWPVVRHLVRNFYSFQEALNALKELYIRAAVEEMKRSGRKVNVSSLSVSTGMHRGEIQRLYKEKAPRSTESVSVITRVIGRWQQDRNFTTRAGEPKILSLEGEDSEFRKLASSVTTAVHSGTILSELERMGAAERSPRGLRLLIQANSVAGDVIRSTELLSQDMESLLQAVDENQKAAADVGNLHIRTEYDNVYLDAIPEIRRWLVEEGKAFHRRAREFLSQHDGDLSPRSPSATPASGRVVLNAFSLTVPNKIVVTPPPDKP